MLMCFPSLNGPVLLELLGLQKTGIHISTHNDGYLLYLDLQCTGVIYHNHLRVLSVLSLIYLFIYVLFARLADCKEGGGVGDTISLQKMF